MSKKLTQEEFVKRAKVAHDSYYDYSKAIYISAIKKVVLVCPIHGDFTQTPTAHIKGFGCRKCGIKNAAAKRSMSNKQFIDLAKTVHGMRYDYSKAEYINNISKVCIVCPAHGDVFLRAGNHLSGRGCPRCGMEASAPVLKQRAAKEVFTEKASAIHVNKYDYSHTTYINSATKVNIKCPDHGFFSISPNRHLNGRGCKQCWVDSLTGGFNNSNSKTSGLLYFIKAYNKEEVFYKIGITSTSVDRRFSGKQAMPYEYELIASWSSPSILNIIELEQGILEAFKSMKYKPKKRFKGMSECFSESEPILKVLPFDTRFF